MKIYKALFVFFIVNSSINFAFSVEMKPKITLDLAVKMANACEKKRLSTNWRPLNIAIVDDGANLILFRRQDGSFLGSIEIAINKAKSAVLIPYPTKKIEELVYGTKDSAPRVPGLGTVDFLVPFAGGLPIITRSGHLIGGIGISGATSNQDEECAMAAINSVKELLK